MVKFQVPILLLIANAVCTLAATKPEITTFRDTQCKNPGTAEDATELDKCFTVTRYATSSVKLSSDPSVPKCPDNSAPVAILFASPWCSGDSQSFPSNITGCQTTNTTDSVFESWKLQCPKVSEKKPIYLETFYDSSCDIAESNTTATAVDECVSVESEHTRAYSLIGLHEDENLCKNMTAKLILYTEGNCTGGALSQPEYNYQTGCKSMEEVNVKAWKIHCV
ncbi:hypothetical protein BDV27DRAFT_158998 [Aspergillus caelatus]|uniref:Uncharacterized protein n=1 Tax=Aspergillus caelatus TaxID=61420 RepID=A0A5N7A050_9EURO|nr:uncharacterized protein BDV27DRAFT_158998 [Aspergillus caelatus]KAE8363244.1 hypothetical protein BDV27DRAFT_158998 [Aspergillus caelatus]